MSSPQRPRRIVLTGASRGLGLEFTRRWLEAGHRVFALSRTAGGSELESLARAHPGGLHRAACDVADDASVAAAARAVGRVWDGVDLLLNNAGTYGDGDATIETVDLDEVRRVFEVNALGPIRVTRAFLPLLRRGTSPRVVQITSLMGSIADNESGGAWAYRLSKAALNMATRNLAHELGAHSILGVAIHPGWVRTDMGGPQAPLAVGESVAAMIRTIDALAPGDTGRFLDLDGDALPW
jgi:NAD(P)-dependent dehydrogenase (short-subunit alcohol dehydrogenase family)